MSAHSTSLPASLHQASARTGPIGIVESLSLRLSAKLARLTHWEFWPAWVIYLPLIPYLAYLSLKHRGITTCTASNPGIPLGGIVGESKSAILAMLPPDSVLSSALIPPGAPDDRLLSINLAIGAHGWSWPIVLKPDAGERGTGVAIIRSAAHARDYLTAHPEPILAQQYHPGPHEVGIFFIRDPDTNQGRIFSITDKRFASVTGDGASTIRSLIWRHPRLRLQAPAHLRHAGPKADTIPHRGETVPLGALGNHCRGTMFLDGAHLITPHLTAAIDHIATRTPGFHFGRFDIRFTHESDLKAGRNLAIVELNGLLSESTNIYDPLATFWSAQRILRRQWSLAYRIGASNRARGTRPASLREIARAIRDHQNPSRQ